jgi:hypothetical protein
MVNPFLGSGPPAEPEKGSAIGYRSVKHFFFQSGYNSKTKNIKRQLFLSKIQLTSIGEKSHIFATFQRKFYF